jgi:hypothetical protein
MSSRPAIQMWLSLHIEGEVFRGDAVPESPSEDEPFPPHLRSVVP